MLRTPPPKHRHDGASPLPLGMDWSPPPRKWNGRLTIWPHDPHTGWSYCVTIPSWVVLPKSRNSDPVVVGIQSPEGITTTRGILRRFNDFLKLSADLNKACPKKNLPPAPPKGLLRMKSRTLLEERRCSLEEWMTKVLSDIDVSRSIAVASFLELEAAARSSFQDENQQSSEPNSVGSSIISSVQSHPHSSLSVVAGSSSMTSDCGSDTAYETSEHGTPRLGRDDSSEFGLDDLTLDEDLTNPIEKLVKFGISNIDEGLFMGQTILEELEGLPRRKVHGKQVNNSERKEMNNGNSSKASLLAGNHMDLFSEQDHSKITGHARKLSNESVGSDVSSQRGSGISGIPNSSADGFLHFHRGAEVSSTTRNLNRELLSGDAQVILPLDQRHKINSVLMSMQRRLATAKTDMEDLIARLNQEIAGKGYLTTKVKDLEVELENTKQKSKENLQQAILIERERFTQMQWDMEELRRKALEMELKLKSEQSVAEKSHISSTREAIVQDKDDLLPELNATKEKLDNLLKRYEELEAKSKADIKVLVKEVKSLRSSQAKLKLELADSLKEKSVAEELLQREEHMSGNAKTCRQKLLYECRVLLTRLRECDINLSTEDENKYIVDSSSVTEAFDLLMRSDNQISLLLGEFQAKLLTPDNNIDPSKAKDDRACDIDNSVTTDDDQTRNIDDSRTTDDELRKLLADMFTENGRLRKQVNSVTRHALVNIISKKDENISPAAENC